VWDKVSRTSHKRREALMHAVVVRSTLHDLERATTFLREQTLPRVRQAPGLVAAQWVRIDENKIGRASCRERV
jgi:hypothetical protein